MVARQQYHDEISIDTPPKRGPIHVDSSSQIVEKYAEYHRVHVEYEIDVTSRMASAD